MNLSSLSIRRPVATIMILLIVVVLGVSSIFSIPLDLMPEIELPIAMVTTSYSNSSPEEVESMITVPIESALASVEGLDTLVSYSMGGMSVVAVQFEMDRNMDFATLDMREKIALISDYLPEEASDPMVMKMDLNSLPVVQLYISSDEMSLVELNNKINDNLVPYFERASGVASVEVTGGVEEEIAIKFSQEELASYGLSLSTIAQMLAAENINLPSGDIKKGSSEVIVRTVGEFENVDDIKSLPLTISDYSIVRLGDIATITEGYADQTDIARIDGSTAIGVMVSKQSDANTVEVSKAVREVIEKLQAENPNIKFTIGYDSADFIRMAISSVASNALMGGILAMIVVFLFLRNFRTTLIIGISIPTSLLAAFAAMNALGITLNLVTLCALTVVVGMLVDNSIVALENIFRVKQSIPDAKEAAAKGGAEIFLAIIASTLTTAIVFVPIAVSDGMASIMFDDFCWTIVIALVASLIVAITVVPMLCSKIMTGTVSSDYVRIGSKRYKYRLVNKFGDFIDNIIEMYEHGIRKTLKKRKRFVAACALVFVLSLSLILTVGFELLPTTDEGLVDVTVDFPYGTSLEDKDEVLKQIESYILSIPELAHVTLTTSSLNMLDTSEGTTLTLSLISKDARNRSSEEIADDIMNSLSYITEADVEAVATSSIMGMFGTSSDISFMIKGQEQEVLQEIGYDLLEQITALDCVENAELDITEGNPEIKVKIDRNVAAYYGITAYQLADNLSKAISGTKATNLTVDGTEVAVNLSYRDNVTDSVESMKQIMITGSYGTSVPVGQIATFEYANAPSVIQHDNQTRYITLNVDVTGNSATSGSSEVAALVDSYLFPDGYYTTESGLYEQIVDAFTDLGKALIIAIALVFLLLAAQFESVLMSFVVMMAVPFAMTGAFLALFLTNTALSMVALLGLVLLVGIVVNNSILLVEFIKQNEETMGISEALVQAGKLRLRPILMSSVTTVVGMIPMAMGKGDGAEMLAPMAISIIGGLIASTIVTLFIIPVIYSLIDDRKNRKRAKKEAKDAHVKVLEETWAAEDARKLKEKHAKLEAKHEAKEAKRAAKKEEK